MIQSTDTTSMQEQIEEAVTQILLQVDNYKLNGVVGRSNIETLIRNSISTIASRSGEVQKSVIIELLKNEWDLDSQPHDLLRRKMEKSIEKIEQHTTEEVNHE